MVQRLGAPSLPDYCLVSFRTLHVVSSNNLKLAFSFLFLFPLFFLFWLREAGVFISWKFRLEHLSVRVNKSVHLDVVIVKGNENQITCRYSVFRGKLNTKNDLYFSF